MDSMEGTYVWVHTADACPRTLVQLYKGIIRIFSNHTASFDGGLSLMEDKVEEQIGGWSCKTCLCCAAIRRCTPT
jgi:hypothetical protein